MSISAQALVTLERAFKEAPQLAEQELLAAATEATLLLQADVQERMPTGATGLTRASVTADAFSTPEGVLGVVGSSQPSALFLELGTRPNPQAAAQGARAMPPADALVSWVRAKFGLGEKEAKSAAYAIAMKIKVRGTKPQRPFALALEANVGQIGRMFESAADRLAVHLTTGGAAA